VADNPVPQNEKYTKKINRNFFIAYMIENFTKSDKHKIIHKNLHFKKMLL